MHETVIDWDGTHLPEELRQLPPGRYYVGIVLDDDDEMSEDEEAAVLEGIAEADAGLTIPLEDAIRQIRSRTRQR